MAVTKDDSTQGAVAPKPKTSAPASTGGGSATGKPAGQSKPASGFTPIQYVGQLVKEQPQISQYALRAAVMTAVARSIFGGDDPLKYSYKDYVGDVMGYAQASSTVMDAVEARIALGLGAGGSWIRNTQPLYEDWSPEGLLNEWLVGPSAAMAGEVAGTMRAEAEGQGVPGALLGTPRSQQLQQQAGMGLQPQPYWPAESNVGTSPGVQQGGGTPTESRY